MARGTIIQRSPDSYAIAVSAGFDPGTGKRRRIWRTIKTKSKMVAGRALTKLQSEVDNGIVPNSGNMRVSTWLDQWLRDTVQHRSRPRTVQGYRSHVETWLKPQFGNLRLDKLEPQHVQRLMAHMRELGRSENTANHVFTTLRISLKDAIRQGLLARNVCDSTDRPKVQPYVVNPPSVSAVKAILNEAKGTDYETILAFMVASGARRGETIALRWESVNFDQGVVSIVESAVRVTGQGQSVYPTKTSSSRRGIQLDESTIAILRQHRAKQAEHILSVANVYSDGDFVFAEAKGHMIGLDCLSRVFRRMARRAGHPNVRLHDLRHFHATALIAAGTHPRVVQERLGHSSAAFTMQVYGHVAAGLQEQAAERFASLMANG